MRIGIAIVDDIEQDRTHLKACVEGFFLQRKASSFSVDLFSSAEGFLPSFNPGKYDMVFLDICMDEMNGIELAKQLRSSDPHLMIVFQTTERSYAFDAFPLHPFDYLVKPCRQEEVDGVLSEAMRVLDAGDTEITVTASRVSYNVPLRSIVAISSQGHNTFLSLTNDQQITCSEAFRSVSAKLESDPRFLLINRGIIINMDHVLSPSDGCMQMKDGSSYPIKVNGRASVLSAFSQYMISQVDKRG